MKINNELIDYLQNLTRLELTCAEREKTKEDLEKILGYVSRLKDAPESNGNFEFIQETELRPDEIRPSLKREDILKNAPRKTAEYFVADKAVE